MSRSAVIRNFLLFQAGWFACVLGGAYALPLAGSLIALAIIALHLWFTPDAIVELKLLTLALSFGLVFESLLVNFQLAHYSNGMLLPGLAPYWMILMWPLFASTLNLSMAWMKNLAPFVVAILGAILAPFAYFAGAGMQAVVFDDVFLSLSIIAIGWAILLPLLVLAAGRFNGYAMVKQTLTLQGGQHNV
jgi:hypothetical protein